MLPASTELPNSVAVPSVGGSSPVSIFMVGGLAAAVGAEEAEDLAALDRQRDVVHGGEVPEAPRQALGVDRDLRLAGRAGRDRQLGMPAALLLGQQRDEALLEILGARSAAISSAGVPVASTLPSSIATIQSHCCASSM